MIANLAYTFGGCPGDAMRSIWDLTADELIFWARQAQRIKKELSQDGG